ncbi:MAG: chemotaxis response regulator protein-glutamate methylesterase [Actinomycetia bacterium]|nr:chemotaxis response regulator protein-glutamate methylesterase [Actinomycetes bacterium]
MLIVDDSAVARGMLTSIFDGEPDFTVVGTASNGQIGVRKVDELEPGLVILDIEMPVMDGLTALDSITKRHPKLPIIMFSTLTERGAAATVQALTKGAWDYAAKPGQTTSLAGARDAVREELVAKARAIVRQRRARPATGARTSSPSERPHRSKAPVISRSGPTATALDAVVLGSSTGGPVALETVLKAISTPLKVPVFIVQHMPPKFTGALADRLDRKTASTVVEAQAGMRAEPGNCYIAPGGHHMIVKRRAGLVMIDITDSPPVNSCRPAVDVLFESAIKSYGGHLLGVMLTGMGSDGAQGAVELAKLGCPFIAQDQETSVVWGMPGAVVEAGAASEVLPLQSIGPRVAEIIFRSHGSSSAPRRPLGRDEVHS